MNSPRKEPQGVALIITLAFLVIATILVVAYVSSMRTERQAAGAMASNAREKLIAQSAVEHALEILDENIPQPVPPGQAGVAQNWLVNPGLLTKYAGPNGSTATQIPLSTNADATVPTADYVNLNAKTLSGSYPIIPTGEGVPASWVYITQDPTSQASTTNPVVGRYAFWMDDENARININTAYGKPATILSSPNYIRRSNPLDQSVDNGNHWPVNANTGTGTNSPFLAEVGFNSLVGGPLIKTDTSGVPHAFYNFDYPDDGSYPASAKYANAVGATNPRYYPVWHPSAINIDILPTSLTNLTTPIGTTLNRNALADWVFNYDSPTGGSTQNWRLLKSPDQIKQFFTTPSVANDFYTANQFNLTTSSRAPEFTAFGKPRLLLEDRISTQEVSPGVNNSDTSSGRLSGTELEFYQTPDVDPFGPAYFHGFENLAPYTGTTIKYYPDLRSVQMVGDYVSSMLARRDWPGMPTRSFVDKWNTSSADTTIGLREADQVAWNIVSMGNYAPALEFTYGGSPDWPDTESRTSAETTQSAGADTSGTKSPYLNALGAQYVYTGTISPNACLRVGALSNKAIMPYAPKPYVSEAALVVTAVPVSTTSTAAGFYLKLSLELEFYIGKYGPPGTFWSHNNLISFVLTHFFYNATGKSDAGVAVNITQGATGYTTSGGDGGSSDLYPGWKNLNCAVSSSTLFPYISALSGSYPNPTLPSGTAVPDIYLPINSYTVVQNTSPTAAVGTTAGTAGTSIYIAQSGTKALQYEPALTNPLTIPAAAQKFSGTVTITAKGRIAVYNTSTGGTFELIPVWDNVDTSVGPLKTPTGQSDSIYWPPMNLDLTSIPTGQTGTFTRSIEVTDPRLGGNTNDMNGLAIWQPHPNYGITACDAVASTEANTLGGENAAETNANFDPETYAYFDFQGRGPGSGFYKNSPRPSIGFLSCVPTGMQRGVVNSTLSLGPNTSVGNLPDWLMLDLVGPSFIDNQATFAPYSYLHSSMGQINLNATIYPPPTATSVNPSPLLNRTLPLQAVFENMVSDKNAGTIASNIANHVLAGSGNNYGSAGYDYIGEVCEIAGVSDGTFLSGSKWQKEALIRSLANLLTVKSNTFRLYGAAQSIKLKKAAGNTQLGKFEPGDTVTMIGEKRFEASLERSVWTGVDGVPGNAHVNATTGAYDQIAKDATPNNTPATLPWAGIPISNLKTQDAVVPVTTATWAQFDGPDDPNASRNATTPLSAAGYPPSPGWYGGGQPLTYNKTPLSTAVNPVRAHMVYKPISFRYITN